MAKLPKKIAPTENASETTLRDFVSSAAKKPVSSSTVHRVNISPTSDDLSCLDEIQNKLNLSRVEVIRAGLICLSKLSDEQLQKVAEDARKSSPKAGRPPVNK